MEQNITVRNMLIPLTNEEVKEKKRLIKEAKHMVKEKALSVENAVESGNFDEARRLLSEKLHWEAKAKRIEAELLANGLNAWAASLVKRAERIDTLLVLNK